jgi:hypothetical protein
MSTFERENYQWRETYFVLFKSCNRPTLKQVEKVLHELSDRLQLTAGAADEDGRFESLTVFAPDDYAALDIGFVAGEEVLEQAATLGKELKSPDADQQEREKLARLAKCDARFDLLHFEEVTEGQGEDALDEMLDPSTLLVVLDALGELTGGVGIDPQSGTLV